MPFEIDSSIARPGNLHFDIASDRKDLVYVGFMVHNSFKAFVLICVLVLFSSEDGEFDKILTQAKTKWMPTISNLIFQTDGEAIN